MSYLPLAHIYEASAQALITSQGAKVAYFQGDIRKILDDWKLQHAKQLEVIRAKQQLGIEAKLELVPPDKPFFKIMMNEKDMLKYVKKLRSEYVVQQADIQIQSKQATQSPEPIHPS